MVVRRICKGKLKVTVKIADFHPFPLVQSYNIQYICIDQVKIDQDMYTLNIYTVTIFAFTIAHALYNIIYI